MIPSPPLSQILETVRSTAPATHRYACIKCRQRKVKCDKTIPICRSCVRDGAECTYSARKPRKGHRAFEKSLVARPLVPNGGCDNVASGAGVEQHDSAEYDEEEGEVLLPREMRFLEPDILDCRKSDQGRLYLAEGKSRYINSQKAGEVAYLQTVLEVQNDAESKDPGPQRPSPASPEDSFNACGLLNPPHSKRFLRVCHPPPHLMIKLWDYYTRNVDTLEKVLYKPDVDALVTTAAQDMKAVSDTDEALLFAIWLATITTMSDEECLQLHQIRRADLVKKYRHALEQSLARVGWMTTQKMPVLQALTLLLLFAPEQNARSAWILSGIALSIAQAMGMHSDSASFSLNPIETEVRRRVWWCLCQIDNRVSEDCGLEVHVPLSMDTKLPLHINDSDLSTSNDVPITPRKEFTEMTMIRIKMEMAQVSLKVKRSKYGKLPSSAEEIATLAREQIHRYESTYLKYLDESFHLHHLCYLGTRLIIAKLWKIIYEGSQQGNDPENCNTKESLLSYNAEILEIAHQLPDKFRQYGWYFRCKSIKWHAMAYLLIELCKPVQGPAVDRAWAVLDGVFGPAEESIDLNRSTEIQKESHKSVLWQSMLKLLKRARGVRLQTLQAAELSDKTLSTNNWEPQMSTLTHTETRDQSVFQNEGLLNDPFFGMSPDAGGDMDMEEWKTWVHGFETDLLYQRESMHAQMTDLTESLGWWS